MEKYLSKDLLRSSLQDLQDLQGTHGMISLGASFQHTRWVEYDEFDATNECFDCKLLFKKLSNIC